MNTRHLTLFSAGVLFGAWIARGVRRKPIVQLGTWYQNPSMAVCIPKDIGGPKRLLIENHGEFADHLNVELSLNNWRLEGFAVCWHKAQPHIERIVAGTNIYFECAGLRLLEREWRR